MERTSSMAKREAQTAKQQQDVKAVLSRDTNTALNEVMRTIRVLEDVYKDETKALKNMDSNKFLSLQDSKFTAARNYQSHMEQIMARKGEIQSADPSIKEKLKNVYAEFSELSQDNVKAIERMQRSTERLGNSLRSAAIRSAQSQRACGYSDNGKISPYAKSKAVSSGFGETI